MPNDFTPSVIPIVRIKTSNVFKTNVTFNPELANKPLTAPMVLGKQTANVQPLLDVTGGDTCVGARVWYTVADVTALPSVGTSPIASECDLTTGDGISTKVQDYQLNFFEKPKIALNDKDCDNFSKFTDRVSFLMAQKMSLMAQALNNRIIADVEANKSATVATNLPDGVTIVGGEYVIAAAGAWTGVEAADTLLILDQLASTRGLPSNYYILSGKTLRISSQLAENKQVNDNQRSFVRLFNRRDISYDMDNLDAIITEDVVYLVDPNVIISFFTSDYPTQGMPVGDKNNTVVYSTPLMYHTQYQDGSDAMSPMQFANNGVMQDVMVDVRHQKTCNITINKNGKPTNDHVWELDLQGLIDFIPVEGTNTGIIRVDQA